MRNRSWLVLVFFCSTLLTSADVKVKSRMSVSGQNMDSTTLIKGSRQRTEMQMGPGMTMVTIHQCDLKRTVQVNDRSKTYMVTPIEDETPEPPAASGSTPPPAPKTPARSQRPARSGGGTLTFTTAITDTGARKPMFGYTARHIKSEMSTQASADACAKGDSSIKTDGWYIDFPGVSVGCAQSNSAQMSQRPQQPECSDKMVFRSTGKGRLGYPVVVDMVMKGSNGQDMNMRQETIALDKATLDAALFDIPAGYRQVSSQAELMGMGDIAAMVRNAQRGAQDSAEGDGESAPPRATRDSRTYIEGEVRDSAPSSGITRVGIVRFSGKNPGGAAETWADQLREQIGQQEMEGIELNVVASDPLDKIEAEARRMGCSYFVFNDVTAKVPSTKKKIGGFIGRATGVDTNALENETTFKFRLFKVGEPEVSLESEVKGTDSMSLELSAEAAAQQEAEQIAERIRQDWRERRRGR